MKNGKFLKDLRNYVHDRTKVSCWKSGKAGKPNEHSTDRHSENDRLWDLDIFSESFKNAHPIILDEPAYFLVHPIFGWIQFKKKTYNFFKI